MESKKVNSLSLADINAANRRSMPTNFGAKDASSEYARSKLTPGEVAELKRDLERYSKLMTSGTPSERESSKRKYEATKEQLRAAGEDSSKDIAPTDVKVGQEYWDKYNENWIIVTSVNGYEVKGKTESGKSVTVSASQLGTEEE